MAEEIQRLVAENIRLRQQIKDNEARIYRLQLDLYEEDSNPFQRVPLDPITLLPDISSEIVVGSGPPPLKGAIPAQTYRDKEGKLRIRLCRSHAGFGWIYTPIADGWVLITHEDDRK